MSQLFASGGWSFGAQKYFFLYYLPAVCPESMDPGALGENLLQPQHFWSILQVSAFPESLPSSLCS